MTDPVTNTVGQPPAAANDEQGAVDPVRVSPFPALVVDGVDVDTCHLADFGFTFDTEMRKGVHCAVKFSTHCFSDKYDPDRHSEHVVVVDEGGQPRCFDRERYELSKGLEALIRALPTSKVFQTPESNFAIVTTQSGREYRVFFNVKKDGNKKMRLYIESAYPPNAERFRVLPTSAYQKVRFGVLVDTLLSGKPLKFRGR